MNSFKQRGFQRRRTCFVFLLAVPLSIPLLYFSYCWGLWGRNSLLLQYFFQCSCPAISEEARYPDKVDVIVSACRNGGVRLSPSGRLLFVHDKVSATQPTYLLELETKSEIPISLPEGDLYFLTDELIYIFVWYGRGHEGGEHIFDRASNKMFPIPKFVYASPDSSINGNADLVKLATALREAKEVYFIDNSTDTVVALASDFQSHPEHNFFMDRFDIPTDRGLDRVEPYLQENKLDYQFTPSNFPDEAVSPDGRFVARADGIYLVETGQKIVNGYSRSNFYRAYSGKYFAVRGWKYDSTGVIYSKFLNPCLIETNFIMMDDPVCFYEVPQPVLLFKVPEEYFSTHETK